MSKKEINKNLVIYQAKSGAIELRGDFTRETIWATQAQIADVFQAERSVVTKHIQNIIKDKELDANSVCANFAHTANDGKVYKVQFYNLDVILAVGYRTNSKRAIEFRQWATKTLRSYIIDGFAVNKNRIAKNYQQFLNVVDDIKKFLPAGPAMEARDAVELVSLFADTWLSLDAYDRDSLPKGKLTKKKVELTADKIIDSLTELKTELIRKSEATDIFGMERSRGSVAGIVGNVMQSFGGKELYESAEEKAAHLLYFMVKNHPFTDGNKRSGAFAFVWFLKQANILNVSKLTPSALTALTILVASSDPKDKDKIVALILNLIAK
ncbi:MAG: virulence protein RhuM/Fic/DOC family protein [Patescibacteria group bacterium]|nr:virulence protein RhuM/Fic/DOC family protein [Patescibacteria group bacterium]MDD5164288.1 virulence protein RhuM/Fic/DOC family protein [Patescibacteria group bacterium]MDD5535031.1 virulence protein RhuM/Fic/DOC family protein [Patescibacteria group bacterium]